MTAYQEQQITLLQKLLEDEQERSRRRMLMIRQQLKAISAARGLTRELRAHYGVTAQWHYASVELVERAISELDFDAVMQAAELEEVAK